MSPRKLQSSAGKCAWTATFLVYINDITTCIDDSVSIKLFADDCLLYNEIKDSNDQVILSNSLAAISDWCDTWEMKLNEEKNVFMRITNKKHPLAYQYTINQSTVTETDSFKYLGVTINNHLTWSQHIDNVCASA